MKNTLNFTADYKGFQVEPYLMVINRKRLEPYKYQGSHTNTLVLAITRAGKGQIVLKPHTLKLSL